MTQSEFLEELKKVAPLVQWKLYGEGRLRTLNRKHCPISFVAWKKTGVNYGASNVLSAADSISLNDTAVDNTVLAADKAYMDETRVALRAKLIEITKPLQTVDA